MKNKKIMFTGGHSTPAFAVLDELLDNGFDAKNIVWVGEKYNQRGNKQTSAEYKTVTKKYKLKFINLKSGKLVRKWTLQTFFNGILEFLFFITGFIKSFLIILKNRPDLVVSFGGFTAVPIVVNAKIFRKKVITHEQTITTGLANKIISRFADRILISLKESEKYFPKQKVVFTGNPIRKDIFEIKSNITKDFDPKLPIIYITGGNQGAHQINYRVFEIINKLINIANVIHQTGNSTVTNDNAKAQELKNNLPDNLKNRYIVKDYIHAEEIGEVMQKADLVVSRAGANTLTEIMALGKLSILIPIPWSSNGEQEKNARFVESLGLGKTLIQSENLTPDDLLKAVTEALSNSQSKIGFNGKKLEHVIQNSKEQVNLNSAKEIYDVVVKILS